MGRKGVNAALLGSTGIQEMRMRVVSGSGGPRSFSHHQRTWCRLLSGGCGPGRALLCLATRSSEIECVFVPVGSILQEDPAKSGGREVLRQIHCFLIAVVL